MAHEPCLQSLQTIHPRRATTMRLRRSTAHPRTYGTMIAPTVSSERPETTAVRSASRAAVLVHPRAYNNVHCSHVTSPWLTPTCTGSGACGRRTSYYSAMALSISGRGCTHEESASPALRSDALHARRSLRTRLARTSSARDNRTSLLSELSGMDGSGVSRRSTPALSASDQSAQAPTPAPKIRSYQPSMDACAR